MTSDVILLITTTSTQDSIGAWTDAETQRQVFCRCESITRQEFFDAAKIGLRPQYKFVIFSGDYAGEEEIVFHGVRYAVYRTYRTRGDDLELYAEAKAGVTDYVVSTT